MFTSSKKKRIVAEIRARMRSFYLGNHIEAACLYWAGIVCDELWSRYHVRTILQAGTMEWPCAAESSDEHAPTHFGYVWEADSSVTRAMIAQDLMPEMHVWAAIPSRNEIVDVTTCFLIHQAKHRACIDWTAAPPPEFLWVLADQIPHGVIYHPDYEATKLAASMLARSRGRRVRR